MKNRVKLISSEPVPTDKFSRLVVSWRKAMGISQAVAANRLGVPKRTLAKWEQGVQRPRGKYVGKLTGLFSPIGRWQDFKR